ncbi:MAG TPA: adenylate/guanylate cyclase domain-containing protein [Acidimicrobiales bacterium]|nr:adenylate/guanylate cyclase domain-containing protein [Acidimicrobiales bacterium]
MVPVRVRRTFAFLDVSGFTALTATQGDERSVEVVTLFRSALRRICSRRAVRIAKWLGDGAMLVGVDASPVVSAALEAMCASELLSEGVELKCGVTSGPVILLEGDDYIGHAVNLAARLCDLASGGQLLADHGVVPHIPAWAKADASPPAAVRGITPAVEVVELTLHCPGPGNRDPVCGIPLVESTAAAWRPEGRARRLLFCSESCLDTWESRPHDREEPDDEAFVRDGIA